MSELEVVRSKIPSLSNRKVERVVALVDTSSSMYADFYGMSRLDGAQRAVRAFVTASSPKFTHIGLVSFDSYAETLVPPTKNYMQLQTVRLQTTGSTNMGDGLAACTGLDPQRVILLSDGQPNSQLRVREALHEYTERKIKVDTVAIGEADLDFMREIAELTGGTFKHIKHPDELAEHYKALETRAYLQLTHKAV